MPGLPLPDIWGEGQQFAFSGLDGPTSWAAGFAGVTLPDRIGLDLYTSGRPRFWVALRTSAGLQDGSAPRPFAALRPRLVCGDALDVEVEPRADLRLRIRVVFNDCSTILGEVAGLTPGVEALAVFEGAVQPLSEAAQAPAHGPLLCGQGDVVALAEYDGLRALRLPPSPQGAARFSVTLPAASAPAADLPLRAAQADFDAAFAARRACFDSLPRLNTDDQRASRTFAKACSVLKVNVESPQGAIPCRWTVPDRVPHRHMWLWDSCFHAHGCARLDLGLAQDALRAVLAKQYDSGFIPHTMTPDGSEDSDITQPPLIAWSAWSLHRMGAPLDFLRESYPRLARYLEWDLSNLDRNRNGLLDWQHEGHDSGMDNSPRFDAGRDLDAVDLNAYVVNEMEHMALIGQALGLSADAASWRRRRDDLARRSHEAFWSEDPGFYFDRGFDGALRTVKTCAGFMPLFAGIPSAQQAARLVEHLRSPGEFWTPLPVASVARDEPTFGDDMWRGPVWPNANLLIVGALRRYGFDDVADALIARFLDEQVRWYHETGALFEFYDALAERPPSALHRKGSVRTRRGEGIPVATDLNWSAAAFVAFAADRWGLTSPPQQR